MEGPKPEGVPDRKRYGPMKLLQFHENYRPAYWGTWNKKSSHISPRCPFTQDKVKLWFFLVEERNPNSPKYYLIFFSGK